MSRAKTCRTPGRAGGLWPTQDRDCGMRSNTLWAFYDPAGSCLRTSAPSLLDVLGWTSSSLDLPRSGSMRNGRVYERPTSVPRTVGSGGSFLPTPRAARGASGTETMYALGAERMDDGRTQGEALLPTPTVGDAANAANRTAGRSDPDSKHHDGVTLVDATRLLPTPRSSDGPHGGPNQTGDGLQPFLRQLGVTTPPRSHDGNTPSDVPPRLPLTAEDA